MGQQFFSRILNNSDGVKQWLPDEYIRGRNINPIGSYVGIATNPDYELCVHGQIYILGTSHPRMDLEVKTYTS